MKQVAIWPNHILYYIMYVHNIIQSLTIAVESPTELQGTVFENKCYTEDSVKKDPDVTTIKTGADREAIIIANDYAHAVDMIKTCKEHKQKPVRDSPLGRHTPKIITHPVRGTTSRVQALTLHGHSTNIRF